MRKVREEKWRHGSECDGRGKDVGMFAVVGCSVGMAVIMRLRNIGFERFTFEPAYSACFKIGEWAMLERVADESQTDEIRRVGA